MLARTAPFLPIVAVPARNEEQRLPTLLAALNGQGWCRGNGPLAVIVVLNNCQDDTKARVLQAAPGFSNLDLDLVEVHFPPRLAHVGSARRLAMDCAFASVPEPDRSVILTTDADAVPESGWVEANLRAVEAGADLVGGQLFGNREEEARLGPGFAARAGAALAYSGLCDRLACLVDPLAHDPWPRHADHTGGSLAIRADLYRALGGLPAQPFREDLALVSKARAAGAKLVHPLDVRVEVSARLAGRAPGGMADCLKAWLRAEAEGTPLLVEDPERVLARCRLRRAIRELDGTGVADRDAAAQRLGLAESDLHDAKGLRIPADALIERFASDDPDIPATVPVASAIARLRDMIADRENASRAA